MPIQSYLAGHHSLAFRDTRYFSTMLGAISNSKLTNKKPQSTYPVTLNIPCEGCWFTIGELKQLVQPQLRTWGYSVCTALGMSVNDIESTIRIDWRLQISFNKKKVKVKSLSCLTLCNPMDCSLPGSSVHGIFQAIVLEWIAISFSRESSQPRDQTRVSRIVDRGFTFWATREEHWRKLQLPTLEDLPHPGTELASLESPTLSWGFFTSALPGKP